MNAHAWYGNNPNPEEGETMKKHFRWLAVLLAIVLVTAACGSDDDDTSEGAGSDTEEAVEQTQGGDLTFHMITHSDDGPFWSVVKRGMDAACADVGVNCVWMPGNNDPGQMVSDIETAIGEGSNGIAARCRRPTSSSARSRTPLLLVSRSTRSTRA